MLINSVYSYFDPRVSTIEKTENCERCNGTGNIYSADEEEISEEKYMEMQDEEGDEYLDYHTCCSCNGRGYFRRNGKI